ncbi:MAG: TerB N-terminal domain-containing protein [Clostridia bacterium]|nr:TerB N-terminal domain-containing protein [Clostridia bacterium]
MKDDFWDIDKLLPYNPARKKTTPAPDLPEYMYNITQDVNIPPKILIRELDLSDITPENAVEYDYTKKSSVIKRVIVSDWQSAYSYSNDFSSIAHRIHNTTPTKKAEYVPFFSYMPQYSDLSEKQFDFYLNWRECVRDGEYPTTDSSYIFLYVYELLAIDDIMPPEKTMGILSELWKHYQHSNPEIDRYFCEWIVDYALIHNSVIDFSSIETVLMKVKSKRYSVIFNLFLFDYIFARRELLTLDNIKFAYDILGNYSPFKNKFYTDKQYKDLLDFCIVQVFLKLFDDGFFSNVSPSLYQQELKMSRPSYSSAVCSPVTKKNITLEYLPFMTNELMRISFSNVSKYIENKIRHYLGYKSRLSNVVLADNIRNIIDLYMDSHYPPQRRPMHKKPPVINETKEIKKVSVNLRKAKEIEDASWKTTEKLTVGLEIFDDSDLDVFSDEQNNVFSLPDNEKQNPCCSLDSIFEPHESEMISLLLKNTPWQNIQSMLLEKGCLPDAVVGSVNEKALDAIGDTIIDTNDYTLIPDYIELLSSFNDV